MTYPLFFKKVETIKLYDPLSEFLGSFDNGIVEFEYMNLVQIAGHSCPTVAGAYLMTLLALKELYKDKLPLRGGIRVDFAEDIDDGVTGVISTVVSAITGATKSHGFKGLGGQFVRHSLMDFGKDIKASIRFSRIDTGESVDVNYNPSLVAFNPTIQSLMQKSLQKIASNEEESEFRKLWQQRVEEILCNYDKYHGLVVVKKV
jgi:formylmethanofuran dehydrogenase subunit E